MDESKLADSLSTVFSGAVVLIIGYVLGGILTLATKIAMARFLDNELYGVFSQGMALTLTLVVISIFGFNGGISRFVSYYSEKNEEKAVSAVPSSLIIVIPVSIIVFSLLFIFSDNIAALAFQDPRTAIVLKAFAVAAPFMAVNSVFISGFRGRKNSKEKVVLMDFLVPTAQLLGIMLVAGMGLGLTAVAIVYAAVLVPTTVIMAIWYIKRYGMEFRFGVVKELVRFSWPLMISAAAAQAFLWGSPLIVGLLETSRDVGLLNAALPLGNATKMFLSAVSFLFLPVASDLFSKGRLTEMSTVYSSATRWIVTASVPMITWMVLLPEESISFLYSPQYGEAGLALMAMMAGYLLNMVTGPLNSLLIALGKTKQEMAANLMKFTVFLITSLVLVPNYGFLGGAASFALGMIVGNLLRLLFAWKYLGMFYNLSFLKPFVAVIPASIMALIINQRAIFLPITLTVFCVIYGLALAIMRPIESEDEELIELLQEKLGLENQNYLNFLIHKFS